MKYLSIFFLIFFISCSEDSKPNIIDKNSKCYEVRCRDNQHCDEDSGICACNDNDKILGDDKSCICKDISEILDENDTCIKDEIAPMITEVKAIDTNELFYTDNTRPDYTFNSDKKGVLLLKGSCEISDKSDVVIGDNTIKFDELYSGLYDDCEIWVKDKAGNESNHLKLKAFNVFNVVKTETIKGRLDGKGVDYVIIGDGFKKDELELFYQKANEFSEYILNYDPVLSKQKSAWNIHVISLVSKESGSDYTALPDTPDLVNTGLDSYFNCYDIQRLLCVNQLKVNYIVAKKFPQFDKVLIIVNSFAYGGAGGDYATTSINSAGKDVAIHELGHSFAGLADEYTYGGTDVPSSEPKEANITLNNNYETVKWKDWLTEDNIDIFEGGGYLEHGVYRPTETSLMRDLGQPFYQVNLEAWTLALYRILGTYFTKIPEDDDVILWGMYNHEFTLELSLDTDMQEVTWFVDDIEQVDIPKDTTTFIFGGERAGKYQVKAVINDKSGVIRHDEDGVSVGVAVWNVTPE